LLEVIKIFRVRLFVRTWFSFEEAV
jgi:hypothetical protein